MSTTLRSRIAMSATGGCRLPGIFQATSTATDRDLAGFGSAVHATIFT